MVTTFTMYTGLPTRAVRIVESQLLSVTLEKKSKKKKNETIETALFYRSDCFLG